MFYEEGNAVNRFFMPQGYMLCFGGEVNVNRG